MINARFYLTPGRGRELGWNGTQEVVELLFSDVFDLIGFCKENEDQILGCTALVDGKVVDLQTLSA